MCGSAKKSAEGVMQDIGALHVERELHVHAGLVLHVLFEALEGVGERRLGQPRLLPILWSLPMISFEYF